MSEEFYDDYEGSDYARKNGDEDNGKGKRGSTKKVEIVKFLREDEVYAMFEKAKRYSTRDWKVLMLLYYFGLRNTEMVNLRKEDIDIQGRKIKIVQGKGGKDRIIPIVEINPFIEKDEHSILDYLAMWVGQADGDYIVGGFKKDGSISVRTVRRIVKKYAELCNVRNAEEVHPHTMRHSYATHLVNMKVPMYIIRALLGHTKEQTTRIYAKMGVDTIRQEVKKYVDIIVMKKELPARLKEIRKLEKEDRMIALLELSLEIEMIKLGL